PGPGGSCAAWLDFRKTRRLNPAKGLPSGGSVMRMKLALGGLLVLAALVVGVTVSRSAARRAAASPIQHVVIIFQENHSFDDVLGKFCATATGRDACDGATTGKLH